MKKLILLASLFAIFFVACNHSEKQVADKQVETEKLTPEQERFLGFWVGDFIAEEHKENSEYVEVNKLNIAIKGFAGDEVIAQSIVAGNVRQLKGKMINKDGILTFSLSEPGDDKYDGKFEFKWLHNQLEGTWTAFDKNLPVTKRSFILKRQEFSYDKNAMLPPAQYLDQYAKGKSEKVTDTIDGEAETYEVGYYRAAGEVVFKINSSTHLFSEQELKNLKKLDLEILRNTIFARHGYSFKKKAYRQFFDFVDWYVPVTDNIDQELTPLEKTNIKLFQRFEKYAAEHYDTYSR